MVKPLKRVLGDIGACIYSSVFLKPFTGLHSVPCKILLFNKKKTNFWSDGRLQMWDTPTYLQEVICRAEFGSTRGPALSGCSPGWARSVRLSKFSVIF